MTPDVRCAAILDPAIEDTRCQLYIGHEGEHALLRFAAANHSQPPTGMERTLLRWTSTSRSHEPFGQDVPVQLPWAPGLPVPIGEVRPTSARSRRSARSTALQVLPGAGAEATVDSQELTLGDRSESTTKLHIA